ncbi:hypothetical protein HK102_009953 [Quaeritorhiza haematococci]|nr:hypothetical protein HK102_009953 [Quaeritorhiza haematococci]
MNERSETAEESVQNEADLGVQLMSASSTASDTSHPQPIPPHLQDSTYPKPPTPSKPHSPLKPAPASILNIHSANTKSSRTPSTVRFGSIELGSAANPLTIITTRDSYSVDNGSTSTPTGSSPSLSKRSPSAGGFSASVAKYTPSVRADSVQSSTGSGAMIGGKQQQQGGAGPGGALRVEDAESLWGVPVTVGGRRNPSTITITSTTRSVRLGSIVRSSVFGEDEGPSTLKILIRCERGIYLVGNAMTHDPNLGHGRFACHFPGCSPSRITLDSDQFYILPEFTPPLLRPSRKVKKPNEENDVLSDMEWAEDEVLAPAPGGHHGEYVWGRIVSGPPKGVSGAMVPSPMVVVQFRNGACDVVGVSSLIWTPGLVQNVSRNLPLLNVQTLTVRKLSRVLMVGNIIEIGLAVGLVVIGNRVAEYVDTDDIFLYLLQRIIGFAILAATLLTLKITLRFFRRKHQKALLTGSRWDTITWLIAFKTVTLCFFDYVALLNPSVGRFVFAGLGALTRGALLVWLYRHPVTKALFHRTWKEIREISRPVPQRHHQDGAEREGKVKDQKNVVAGGPVQIANGTGDNDKEHQHYASTATMVFKSAGTLTKRRKSSNFPSSFLISTSSSSSLFPSPSLSFPLHRRIQTQHRPFMLISIIWFSFILILMGFEFFRAISNQNPLFSVTELTSLRILLEKERFLWNLPPNLFFGLPTPPSTPAGPNTTTSTTNTTDSTTIIGDNPYILGQTNLRVILVIIDGMRSDYMYSNSKMRNIITSDWVSRDSLPIKPVRVQSPSMSVPNWLTYLTGAPPWVHGVVGNIGAQTTAFDSIFSLVLKANKTAGLTASSWFSDLIQGYVTLPNDHTNDASYPYRSPQGLPDSQVADMQRTVALTEDILNKDGAAKKFDFYLVHFSDVDTRGHYDGVTKTYNKADTYESAVTTKAQVWERILEGVGNDTIVVTVSDHGHVGHGGSNPLLMNTFAHIYKKDSNWRSVSPLSPSSSSTSIDSTDAALEALKRLQIFQTKTRHDLEDPAHQKLMKEEELGGWADSIDIAPTICGWLGLAPPSTSLGAMLPELCAVLNQNPTSSSPNLCQTILRNWQVQQSALRQAVARTLSNQGPLFQYLISPSILSSSSDFDSQKNNGTNTTSLGTTVNVRAYRHEVSLAFKAFAWLNGVFTGVYAVAAFWMVGAAVVQSTGVRLPVGFSLAVALGSVCRWVWIKMTRLSGAGKTKADSKGKGADGKVLKKVPSAPKMVEEGTFERFSARGGRQGNDEVVAAMKMDLEIEDVVEVRNCRQTLVMMILATIAYYAISLGAFLVYWRVVGKPLWDFTLVHHPYAAPSRTNDQSHTIHSIKYHEQSSRRCAWLPSSPDLSSNA